MVIKINYTSSDIYVSTSVSPVYVVVSNGGSNGSAVWGRITGTLADQTDLQNALNAKFDDPTGTTAQYLRGDGSLATFPTITNGTVTSVDMSVPTGLTISGNPITSSGTLAVGLASGYSIPSTASQATWNTAYNDSIVSAGVTGTTTKTLTLNQQDGGTVTASWTDDNTDAVTSVFGRTGAVIAAEGDYTLTQLGDVTLTSPTNGQVLKYNGTTWVNNTDTDTGLTSVGLSMPVAFSVANTPLTANGTLAVSAVGTSAQYIRGDGQLATLPTGAGGGSSVNYYLNGSVNQGTIGGSVYYEMNRTPVIGAGTDFTRTNLQGDGLIAQFITDANDPNRLEIPAGAWNIEMYFNVSSAGGSPAFYLELLKYDGTTFTSIASGSTNPEIITGGTAVDLYLSSLAVPQTTLLATDRLAIRVYVITSGRNITLHTEDNNLCEIITTFAGGVSSLNGLTANTQYFATGTSGTDFAISSATDTHTFNLPTASATNRGALSSADWTTFNSKPNGNIYTADGTLTADRTVTSNGNSLTILGGKEISSVQTALNLQTSATNISVIELNLINTFTTTGKTWRLRSLSGGEFDIVTGSSTRPFYATGTGRVAINGTTLISDAVFSVNGVIGTSGGLQIQGGTGTPTGAGIEIEYNGGTSYFTSYNRTGGAWLPIIIRGSQIDLFTAGSNRARITSAGRLLLGTTTESTFLLDVNGTARVSGNLTASSFIKSGGTSSQYLMADGSTSTLTNPVTGTGTTNYLPKWTSGSAIGNSLVYDDGTNVGIGITSPTAKLHTFSGTSNNQLTVDGTGAIKSGINFASGGTTYGQIYFDNNAPYDMSVLQQYTTGSLILGTNNTERLRITSGGNVLVGTTTDSGERLQVSGAVKSTQYKIAPNGTNFLYNIVDSDASYAGAYAMQAGGGSSGFGGGFIAFGHSHATKPGWVTAGISAGSGGRFTVNNEGLGGGTDVFIVEQNGDVNISGVFRETVTTNRQTASYTLALADNGKLVEMNVATANNLTVPLNSSVTFPIGTKIDLAQYGAGQTTIVATSGVTVRSAGGALKLAVQYSGGSLVKIGTDEWYLFGDITV
jgi:hypothetical protein